MRTRATVARSVQNNASRLFALDDDLLVNILSQLASSDLVTCTLVCRDLWRLTSIAAAQRYRACRPMISSHLLEPWLQALAGLEALEAAVGPRDRPERTWKNEWLHAVVEHLTINGQGGWALNITASSTFWQFDAVWTRHRTRDHTATEFDFQLFWLLAPVAQAMQEHHSRYSFDPPLREPNFRWYSVLLANQARETVRK